MRGRMDTRTEERDETSTATYRISQRVSIRLQYLLQMILVHLLFIALKKLTVYFDSTCIEGLRFDKRLHFSKVVDARYTTVLNRPLAEIIQEYSENGCANEAMLLTTTKPYLESLQLDVNTELAIGLFHVHQLV